MMQFFFLKKNNIIFVLSFFFFFNILNCSAINSNCNDFKTINKSYFNFSIKKNHFQFDVLNNRPNPFLKLFRNKQKNGKRITALCLAFPFPFGIVGLHRIYLGCAPHVPPVYIATIGGVFGILPTIDFILLLKEKNTDVYSNNKNVFMWGN